jgi:predicted DNA-binding transcriptional regulator AlpA
MSTSDANDSGGRELADLVTGAEAARRLGVSTQRLHQLAARDDFPPALGKVGQAVIWRWAEVEQWGRNVDRPQPYLTTTGPGFRFETEPRTPGEIKISNLDGSHAGFAIAWIGTPIIELEADTSEGVIVRTTRREGRISRNSKGTWALHDSAERPKPQH